MADVVDQAAEYEEVFTSAAIDAAKNSRKRRRAFTGLCHNCGVEVDDPVIFCDTECENEHEYFEKRRRINGHP